MTGPKGRKSGLATDEVLDYPLIEQDFKEVIDLPSTKVWKRLFVVLGLILAVFPIIVWAVAPEAKEAVALAPEVPAAVGMWKTLFTICGAMMTVVLTAWATAYVQGKIGPAGCGAMAEKPEVSGTVFIMIAIPETLVVLGFVISAMIILMVK